MVWFVKEIGLNVGVEVIEGVVNWGNVLRVGVLEVNVLVCVLEKLEKLGMLGLVGVGVEMVVVVLFVGELIVVVWLNWLVLTKF